MATPLAHVSIVLVNSEYPENIGSVARCMKNMGLRELILINPVPYQRLEAYALAHRSRDILDKAVVYDNLAEALKPFVFVIGTTQRVRGRHYPLHTPAQIVGEIQKRGPASQNRSGVRQGIKGTHQRGVEKLPYGFNHSHGPAPAGD